MKIKLSILIPLFLMVFCWIFTGCEGPSGDRGLGFDDLDLEPPDATFFRPEVGDSIYTDTTTFSVEADDNRQIAYVEFFIDGSSSQGEQTLARIDEIKNGRYSFLWNFLSSETPYGFHLLTARAVDRERNHFDTSPIPIWYLEAKGEMYLYYFGKGDEDAIIMPDPYFDRNFNVRFTPLRPCTLKEIQFEFVDPGEGREIDIEVIIWSSNNFIPDEEVMRKTVTSDEIEYNGWWGYDVSNEDLPVFAGDFHAGFSALEEMYGTYVEEERYIILKTHVDPENLDNAKHHRSGEYEAEAPGRGWGSMQEQWEAKIDFHIRALVDYGNGETVFLLPDGVVVPGVQQEQSSKL